jgi:hypothetical protein
MPDNHAHMEQNGPLKQPPLFDHLEREGWSRDELETAAADVKALMETDGWKAILRSIEARLRHEQRVQMMSPPRGEDYSHERVIGQWAGLRSITAIAEGIVRAGKAVAQERAA